MTEEFEQKGKQSLEVRPELEGTQEGVPEVIVSVETEELAAMWEKTYPEGGQEGLMALIARLSGEGKTTESDWILRMSGLAESILTSQSMAKREAGMDPEEKIIWLQDEIETAEREFLDGNVFAMMEGTPVYVGAEVKFRAMNQDGAVNDRLLRVGESEGNVARVDLTAFLTLNE